MEKYFSHSTATMKVRKNINEKQKTNVFVLNYQIYFTLKISANHYKKFENLKDEFL